MAMFQNLSLLKVFGTFGLILMVIIWGGGAGIGLYKAIKTGDVKGALGATGGKIFAIDSSIHDETDYLLTTDDAVFVQMFHISFILSLLFMLFVVGFLFFKLGNWLIGIKQFSAWSDVLIITLIILVFLLLQFFYAYIVLDKVIIPFKDGIWYFIKNSPEIFSRMTSPEAIIETGVGAI